MISSRSFKCVFDNAKKSFYKSFNAIFGRIGRYSSAEVVIHLLKVKCLPIILYATQSIQNLWTSLFSRHSQRFLKPFPKISLTNAVLLSVFHLQQIYWTPKRLNFWLVIPHRKTFYANCTRLTLNAKWRQFGCIVNHFDTIVVLQVRLSNLFLFVLFFHHMFLAVHSDVIKIYI